MYELLKMMKLMKIYGKSHKFLCKNLSRIQLNETCHFAS